MLAGILCPSRDLRRPNGRLAPPTLRFAPRKQRQAKDYKEMRSGTLMIGDTYLMVASIFSHPGDDAFVDKAMALQTVTLLPP